MRYRVNRVIIRSENAAKPKAQKSKYIADEFKALYPVKTSLDYGCGKLRYLENYLQNSDEVFLYDSQVQLSRQQKIWGDKTSIIEFSKTRNNIALFCGREIYTTQEKFDRIFCINVLSAVPILSVRWRILRNCYRLLKPNGQLVVTHQYRNSDFNRMRKMPNAYEFRDGYIINSLRGHSFYSTFSREELREQLIQCGFYIALTKIFDGTVFYLLDKN